MTSAEQLLLSSIPIIDISPWLGEDLDESDNHNESQSGKKMDDKEDAKLRVCDDIRKACRQWGFLILVGLPLELTDSIIPNAAKESSRFFNSTKNYKTRLSCREKEADDTLSSSLLPPAYGYFGMESESLSYDDENDNEEEKKKPDLREAFSMGPVSPMSDRLKTLYSHNNDNGISSKNVPTLDGEEEQENNNIINNYTRHHHTIHKHVLDFCYQPTPWPEENNQENNFESAMIKFYTTTSQIGRVLLKILAKCLDLPENYFHQAAVEGEHCNSARAIWYPKLQKEAKAGQYRCGPHTDSGVLTLLWTNGSGLEIQKASTHDIGGGNDKNGCQDNNWIPIENVPSNAFIMNIGDILQEASGNRYKWRSTPHRVPAPKLNDNQHNQDRLVLVLFLILAADFPIPNCNDENNRNNKKQTKTQGEHLFNQFQKWIQPSCKINLSS